MAGAALRVLGLAYRELPEEYTENDFDRELTYVGLVGMSDPLRDEAKAAIARGNQKEPQGHDLRSERGGLSGLKSRS